MILGLAPMDGFTNCAYRYLVDKIFEKYNKDNELWTWTEFMNADGYLARPGKLTKHLMTIKGSKNVIAQIFGGDEEKLVKTAISIEKNYKNIFAGIELNIGCPAPKVVLCGGGSGLMKDKQRTLTLIKNLKDSVKMPFSIKTRTGTNDDDKDSQFEFIKEASKYCHMLTIHGRTFKQGHSFDVDREFIYRAKEAVSKINPECKIIGNGGIKSYEEAITRKENLDGIMIGQGSIGNPWMFTQHIPEQEEKFKTVVEHLHIWAACDLYFKNLENNESEFVLEMPTIEYLLEKYKKIENEDVARLNTAIEFRKFLFSYVKGIEGSKEFKIKVASIKDYEELLKEIMSFLG